MKRLTILIFLILNTLSYSEKYSFTIDIDESIEDINIIIVKEDKKKNEQAKEEKEEEETISVINKDNIMNPFEELLITGITDKHILFSNGAELHLGYASRFSDITLEEIIEKRDMRRFMKVRLCYRGKVKEYEVGDRIFYMK